MPVPRWLGVAATVVAMIQGASSETLDPPAWLAALDKPQIDGALAIAVEGQLLRIGPAVLRLESGVLVPTQRIGGNIEEAVFVGNGRLQYEPPDLIERGQLELFTGRVRVDEPFEHVVIGGAGLKLEALFVAGAKVAPSIGPEAEKLLATWRGSAGRLTKSTSERLLAARIDPDRSGAFAFAALDLKDLGKVRVAIDPEVERTPFSVSHYEEIELTEWDKRNARYQNREQLQAGRFLDWDLDHIAIWDTWSAVEVDELASSGPALFATGYEIDVMLDPGGEKISGTSTMHVSSKRASRCFQIELHRDLKLIALRDGNGIAIPYRLYRGSVWAFLPSPLAPGSTTTISAEFAGTLFEKTERKQYRTWNTLGWQPHLVERANSQAPHTLKVRWSPPLDVRLSGQKVNEGSDSTQRWIEHSSVVPSLGVFMEVGQFEDVSIKRGERTVTVAFSAENKTWMKPAERKRFVEEVHNILDWMESQLGPPPIRDISLIIVDQGYGQSLPGTIIIPDYTLRTSTIALTVGASDWRLFLAHEIAHQWWGNSVVPASDGDAWLSEAMAEYMSQLYGMLHLNKELGEDFVPVTKWWRSALEQQFVAAGRPVESVGPIMLGSRLNSSRCPGCYDDIVYTKGSLALQALGQYLREPQFLKMLREVTTRLRGKTLDSASFLAMISKMSGEDLGWFRQRYLEGTGLPTVFYSYHVDPAPSGGWDVTIDIEQESDILVRYRIEQTPLGRFEVVPYAVNRVQEPTAAPLPIPVRLSVVNSAEPPKVLGPRQARTWRDEANWRLDTRAILRSGRGTVRIHSDFKVVEAQLDPEQWSLAEFGCSSCYPKGTLRSKAARAILAGQLDVAETLLDQALQSPFDGFPEPKDMGERITRKRETAVEDAVIAFLKARVALLRGDIPRAEQIVHDAELATNVDGTRADRTRDDVKGGIALARGEFKKAYQLLWKVITAEGYPGTSALLQMAIAAHHAGETAAYEKAMRRAKQRFADVSVLEKIHPLSPGNEDAAQGAD